MTNEATQERLDCEGSSSHIVPASEPHRSLVGVVSALHLLWSRTYHSEPVGCNVPFRPTSDWRRIG